MDDAGLRGYRDEVDPTPDTEVFVQVIDRAPDGTLLYFNQIFGSVIKILVFFRLDRQRWTRQNTTLKPSDTPLFDRFKRYSSVYVTVLAVAVYIAALAVVSGVGAPQRTMPVGVQSTIGGLI